MINKLKNIILNTKYFIFYKSNVYLIQIGIYWSWVGAQVELTQPSHT